MGVYLDEERNISWPQREDLYTHNGQSMTLEQWAASIDRPFQAFAHYLHLHRGDIAKVLPEPADEPCDKRGRSKLLTHDGRTMTLREWSAETGIRYQIIYDRMHISRWSIERALTTPVGETRRTRRTKRDISATSGPQEEPQAGDGEQLSSIQGDRRGMVRAISDEIGVFA